MGRRDQTLNEHHEESSSEASRNLRLQSSFFYFPTREGWLTLRKAEDGPAWLFVRVISWTYGASLNLLNYRVQSKSERSLRITA